MTGLPYRRLQGLEDASIHQTQLHSSSDSPNHSEGFFDHVWPGTNLPCSIPVDYLRHLGASTLWTFRGHRYACGASDNKDHPADQPQIRTDVKPNALDGMVFRFNPFMFKNP